MGRFDENSNEEEFQPNDDFYEPENEENEEEHSLSEQEYAEFLQQMQIQLAESDLNQKLLSKSIRVLEKSFFWRFRLMETKLRLIARVYKSLQKLISEKDE
jgi:hypothetical protein